MQLLISYTHTHTHSENKWIVNGCGRLSLAEKKKHHHHWMKFSFAKKKKFLMTFPVTVENMCNKGGHICCCFIFKFFFPLYHHHSYMKNNKQPCTVIRNKIYQMWLYGQTNHIYWQKLFSIIIKEKGKKSPEKLMFEVVFFYGQ